MKHLCCSKLLMLMLFTVTTLFAGLSDKSAILYYGDNISYPMVGIHDYIIVQPSNTNVYTHGFDVYKDKMYAYVSIGEIDKDIDEYKDINKSWIIGTNKAWKSDVLDLTNPDYQKFLFSKMIEPQIKRGFKNFFFDTLDSYEFVAKTPEQKERSKESLIHIIKTFHKRYPHAKLIINRGFEIIDTVHNDVTAVLFESYFNGVQGQKASYYDVNDSSREWLNKELAKVQKYKLDIIAVDYLPFEQLETQKADKLVNDLQKKGFIPYVTTQDLSTYGKSSKNALKREILTLVDTSNTYLMETGAHLYGALPLEYLGYIQKLYDINQPLPKLENMQQYAGVIVWLPKSYTDSQKLVSWLTQVKDAGIKIVFAGNFGLEDTNLLNNFGIKSKSFAQPSNNINSILMKDKMMGYEMDPPLFYSGSFISISSGKALYSIKDSAGHTATLAALMPWGGFALENSFMTTIDDDNIWTINPFEFFQKAFRLKKIPVPDTTTQNGKRIFFSHIDGDAIMNRVEWNPKLFSGEVILSDFLKKYHVPISVSIVGAEVDPNGLYPKISPQLQKIVKNIYKLPNIEGATHTFSHPFFWQELKNGDLAPKYRLKPKGYKFSLAYEISGMLQEINEKYYPKNKLPKAHMLFWSGNCMPQQNAISYVYEHHILNMNGGDTYIMNSHPWLSYIAPYGIERGEYYQIYTGAQDENVYTNDWKGPYWGFKNTIQTFKLTNSPRRFKPIDVYYHYYSASKRASYNALKYVYDWVIKQDTNPIFTSEYIPKAMDYYTVSLAQENGETLLSGFKDLKTVRIEKKDAAVNLTNSKNIAGYNHFENHTYVHAGTQTELLLKEASAREYQTIPYLVSANGRIKDFKQTDKKLHLILESHLPVKLQLFIPQRCHYKLTTGYKKTVQKNNVISFNYKHHKKVTIDAICR
ncbi:endo alpha-1,4 polygalactosaminidase [Sulfurimonas paralvinellae]|uniref:Glycoside-hydrolase family GH114 TIM-barrel domain-containing protein n=1 Tax=Sulfurimonas paralvinellae TaxID=317658 RepID=A0A7M1B5A4_9BACT|nr:endo alpha-1,4 polygalactosaminidase [Sulfurimonas paralvinellae]QOP44913.1 hypothetical protein FM071_00820 [Sulfurimonas paralvinellae]